MIPRCFVLLLLLLIPLAPGTAQSVSTGYELGSGDELRITVFNHPELSGEFVVGSEGTISMPLIGDVEAEGRTIATLERAIRDALQPDFLKNPSVSIEVLNYRPFYILGEVKEPGSYPYVAGMRVVNAVALAGGYTYRARKNKVIIERSGGAERSIEAGPDTVVLPGDIIRVRERFF